MRGKIPEVPNDAALARMSPEDIARLTSKIAKAYGDEGVEELSDALLRISKAWTSGAHSESADTRRQRRIESEASIHICEDSLVVAMSDDAIRRSIAKGARAALAGRQLELWLVVEEGGWSQARAAAAYDVSPGYVSQCINQAKELIKEHIDLHDPIVRMFLLECHRGAYFAPAYRPELPPELDEARRELERQPEITTHIQIDAPLQVEIWTKGDRPPTDSRGKCPSLTFSKVISESKKTKKDSGFN